MAQRKSSFQSSCIYLFTINILKVTRIPSPMRLSFSASSSSLHLPSKRTLKITVLHGSKQKQIGEFEILKDECLIDQKISCRLFCTKEDDLGKLHIYIEQGHSAGLAGYVALDLKEFVQEMDSEVYIKYPLSASSPREGYVPKLKLTLECTCLGNPENVFISDVDTIIHHKRSLANMTMDTTFLKDKVNEDSTEDCPEMDLLQELGTVLLKLDAKLKNFVATCKAEDESEKDIPVDCSSTVVKSRVFIPPTTTTTTTRVASECSDCVVCAKAMSKEKMDDVDGDVEVESEVAGDVDEKKVKVAGRGGGVLKNVMGGMLLVGISVFAVTSYNKRRGNPVTWPYQKRKERDC